MVINMKCPDCKSGDLSLYRVTETVYRIPITKRNTFSKRRFDNTGIEYPTSMDYLECDNDSCQKHFEYVTDDNGKIEILWER